MKQPKYEVMYFKTYTRLFKNDPQEKWTRHDDIKLYYTGTGTVRVKTRSGKITEWDSSHIKTTNIKGRRTFKQGLREIILIQFTPKQV